MFGRNKKEVLVFISFVSLNEFKNLDILHTIPFKNLVDLIEITNIDFEEGSRFRIKVLEGNQVILHEISEDDYNNINKFLSGNGYVKDKDIVITKNY